MTARAYVFPVPGGPCTTRAGLPVSCDRLKAFCCIGFNKESIGPRHVLPRESHGVRFTHGRSPFRRSNCSSGNGIGDLSLVQACTTLAMCRLRETKFSFRLIAIVEIWP